MGKGNEVDGLAVEAVGGEQHFTQACIFKQCDSYQNKKIDAHGKPKQSTKYLGFGLHFHKTPRKM